MARSDYVRKIRAIFADHAAAERLELPVDEYRDLRDEARAEPDGVSRCLLLGRAATLALGVAGAAALPQAKARAATRPTAGYSGAQPRIAVTDFTERAGLRAPDPAASRGAWSPSGPRPG